VKFSARRSAAAIGLAVAALLGGCTADRGAEPVASPSAQAPAELQRYSTQQLDWQPCGDGALCATLRVPKDYADPTAHGDFELAVLKVPATGERRGSLVVNPGGPGGSGAQYAAAAPGIVTSQVLDAYDVVGFDPRGVGGSDPVDCLSDAELDALIEGDPSPDDAAEVAQTLAAAERLGRGCQELSPDIAPWIDSKSVVRDMDVLRAALGEERLDYLGKSYGTTLGALYAQEFPERVGRFVLDGVLDPALTSEEVSLGQARAFETALRRFLADCLQQQDCPLAARTVDDGVAELQRFFDGLESQPLPGGDGRDLTQALGISAVLYYLYFPPGDWAQLRAGLADAYAGDGSTLVAMLDRRLQRDPGGVYGDNSQEAFYAVTCLDRQPAADGDPAQRAQRFADAAPVFGPALAWSDAVCSRWPQPPVGEPAAITAAGAAPILVVSTQYDPATPYAWGAALAQRLESAALVSSNADGHTGYRSGSTCVDDAVDAYLLDGTVPATDPRCGY
jgi:pimeloyl-ACP methyl ester carboxylesterase